MHDELTEIEIVGYAPIYKDAFKRLNEEWIEKHFVMEEADHKVLDHPEEQIISKGGHILFAVRGELVAGTCAIIKSNHQTFEFDLAKMGVDPRYRGNGIGFKLGVAAIQKAKELGAKNVFLESNTLLAPAINLYKKLGFVEFHGEPSLYERADIQMMMEL